MACRLSTPVAYIFYICKIMSKRVYCIKTMYNKKKFGLNESTDYVLFKKGYFYETEVGSYMTFVVSSNGLKFTIDSTYFVSEQEWRESRLNDLGL